MSSRFEFKEGSTTLMRSLEHGIVKDKETGVLYYIARSKGTGAPLSVTPLLDENGKPIVEK